MASPRAEGKARNHLMAGSASVPERQAGAAAEVLNLLDSRDKDIAYFYESYIRGFDVAPIEGRLSRVVEPRTLRVGAKIRF